jgi:hypothetical protein
MANLLTNIGEEYVIENNANGATVKVGLYNDSTDSISDSDDLAQITTEPSGAAYAQQTSTVTTRQIGSDFGFDNDSKISFDTSNSSSTVDHAAFIVNFQSDSVAGDSSANDHLIGVAALSQSRDLSQIDTVEVAAGDLEVVVN